MPRGRRASYRSKKRSTAGANARDCFPFSARAPLCAQVMCDGGTLGGADGFRFVFDSAGHSTAAAGAGRNRRNRPSGSGNDPSVILPRRGRMCEVPGCLREYLRSSHRHGCSMCSVGSHTERCGLDWHRLCRRQRLAQERASQGRLAAYSTVSSCARC